MRDAPIPISRPKSHLNREDRLALIVSANKDFRTRLKDALTHMRWRSHEAGNGAEAMSFLYDTLPGALLVDDWLPDLEIDSFAEEVGDLHPQLELLRVDKPSSAGQHRELANALRDARQTPGMRETAFPEQPPDTAIAHEDWVEHLPGMIGDSAPMRELARLVRLVAPSTASVLIQGETGTGKELVANALHDLSPRSTKPFAVLNCAAIPEALLEAELFGHTRGAFTGAVQARVGRIEAANGGMLFLDEIGEMPLALQSKMLRFLESGELQRVGDNAVVQVDVRVVAATHEPLEERADEGRFRLDLFHRLAVFPIDVPALRERMDDLPMLTRYFLSMHMECQTRLSCEAMEKLQGHAWPGNVRELGHVIRRACILADGKPAIGADEIRLRLRTA